MKTTTRLSKSRIMPLLLASMLAAGCAVETGSSDAPPETGEQTGPSTTVDEQLEFFSVADGSAAHSDSDRRTELGVCYFADPDSTSEIATVTNVEIVSENPCDGQPDLDVIESYFRLTLSNRTTVHGPALPADSRLVIFPYRFAIPARELEAGQRLLIASRDADGLQVVTTLIWLQGGSTPVPDDATRAESFPDSLSDLRTELAGKSADFAVECPDRTRRKDEEFVDLIYLDEPRECPEGWSP